MNWALPGALSIICTVLASMTVFGWVLLGVWAWGNHKRNSMEETSQRECAETQIDEWT